MEKIILVGGGGHCKVIIDIINSIGNYEIVGITDANKATCDKIYGIPVLGDDSILEYIFKNGVNNAFICIGALNDKSLRGNLYNKLKSIGYTLPVIIHKNATVSISAKIGDGTCVMAGSVINADTVIESNCIINTNAVVEHECTILKGTHVSPNCSIGGGTNIGSNCHIGIGSTVIQGISIGNNVVVGAGAVVIENIIDDVTVVGVPAKIIKYR